ncbi:MAG: Gfo/Idh/MocA family oxidoreductase [Planctomycetes bacterium]|nr:Gfo/Idh/MocA family oxidoreductase [Planctomycetota bacterium]
MTAPPQVVVVGAGAFGRNHVRIFSELGALAAVADPDEGIRLRSAQEHPGIELFESFDAALGSPHPALVLATPAPLHFGMARAALQASKDVLVEKPMTLDVAEARELEALARTRGRVLMVGHLLLFQPAVSWMKQYLESGRAGRVRRISTQRTKLGTVRSAENVWWSFAPHDVSVVLHLLGSPELESVHGTGRSILQSGIEDEVHVELGFAGGASAHLHCSWLWPDNVRRTTVLTEREMLVHDEVAGTVTVYQSSIGIDLRHHACGSEVLEFPQVQALELECRHFLEMVATRSRPLPDGANGVAVVEVLQRAQNAFRA